MAEIIVRYYATMRRLTGREEEKITAGAVRGVVSHVRKSYDRRAAKQLEYCNIFVNNTSVAFLDGLGTRLKDGDTVHVFPPLGGG
ncbi:MAG: MoaD family protein [bacterium]